MIHQIWLLMIIFALLYLLYQWFRRKYQCNYCGGEWLSHEDHCPWKVLG